MPRISGKDLLRALRRLGFTEVRVRGSHHYLRRPGELNLVCVPVHGNRALPLGTLASILNQSGLSPEDLAL